MSRNHPLFYSGRILLALILLLILGACRSLAFKSINAVTPEFKGEEMLNIPYGEHPRQYFDIYLPPKPGEAKAMIIFVYGGAWQFGDRSQYRWVGQQLASMGYVTALPDYRLFPEVQFPDFIVDVAQAIPVALERCRKISVCQSDEIVLIGHSAGAHTASMLALDRRYFADEKIRVIGWVGLSGPYDFLPLKGKLEEIFPSRIKPEQTQPINFVSPDDPPALLIHGKDDTRVDPANSYGLAQALNSAGVPVRSRFYSHVRHAAVLLSLSGRLYSDLDVKELIAGFLSCLHQGEKSDCEV